MLAAAFLLIAGQEHNHPGETIPDARPELRPALLLMRENKTEEARRLIQALLAKAPDSAELHYQLARSWLLDFYGNADPVKSRTSLALAMEALDNALRRDPNHIPALKAKAVIHARAELLYYNPNLTYQLGLRVAKLQPAANEYILTLTDWLSGEVRFNVESEHRVPHDPETGLDRSIELLDRVIDSSMPHTNEEAMALFQMGRSLSRRGKFPESIRYFEMALARPIAAQGRPDILREIGTAYFRSGNYPEAARTFYRALDAQNNYTDQWLLRVALAMWKDSGIRLPEAYTFPAPSPEPSPSIVYEDMAAKHGVDRFDGNGTCAFADFDGDGKLDLALAGSGTMMALYRNEGSKFRAVTAESGLANVPSGYSLNAVDYDNDGRIDLYVTMNGWNGGLPNRLFLNEGSGKFRDVSKESGSADPGDGFVSVWGDLDNDGLLDIVIANGVLKDGTTPQVYRNKGNGTFENVTLQAGIKEPPTYGAIGAALGDYDRDGDLDIFINGLGTAPNRLYRNEGRMQFRDVTRAARVTQPNHNGFVAFFTDYNNDAYPDLLTTSLAPWEAVVQGLTRMFRRPDKAAALHPDSVRLFRNNKDGTFADVTAEAGLGLPMGIMGSGVADLDNDGNIDFYFGTGDPQLTRIEPNRLFRNNGNGTFTDITDAAGVWQPGKKGHGVCFTDVDENGSLEMYAQLGGHYPGDHARNAWYQNKVRTGNHWLELELTGVRTNRFGVGAAIVVTAGGRKFYREVKGSEGFGSTNPYRQHFGLGKADRVELVEIFWPGGARQELRDVKVDQVQRIREETLASSRP